MKKFLFTLCLGGILFVSCSPQGLQGHPAAIQAGASVGGVLGSIVGDRSGGYHGSQFGALIGTVAGVAIGNAISTPRSQPSEGYPVDSRSQPPQDVYADSDEEILPSAASRTPAEASLECGLRITNLRFIDANRNHVIDAEEDSKLVFDLVNEGSVPVYQVTPIVEVLDQPKQLLVSPSLQIAYMEVGSQIRYTATIRGRRRLKTGEVEFRVYASDSRGCITEVHSFTLPTQKREKK